MKKNAIKISYDERALSLIDTYSLGSWNINMLEDNVMDSVVDRISNMDKLQALIDRNQSEWSMIDKKIENGFNDFASLVRKT